MSTTARTSATTRKPTKPTRAIPDSARAQRFSRAWKAVLAASLSSVAAVLALSQPVWAGAAARPPTVLALSLSRFLALARAGAVSSAVVDGTTSTVRGTVAVGGVDHRFVVTYPAAYGGRLTQTLLADGVPVSATAATAPAAGSVAASSVAADAILGAGLVVMAAWLVVASRRRRDATPGRGPGRPQSAANPAGFAKGHGEQVEVPPTRFADIAGLDEAVEDLSELVDYLREPERYQAAGADLPRGYLLVGPPGTGKTLLARAVAGEAGVPFFAVGASEFVESYVGVGAARVRALFDRARAAPAAIVFIDELDAVGRRRSGDGMHGNEERESTLNQLLMEMDGFASSSLVILGATNRPDVLDQALRRPGRFDRQIVVPTPDRRGRSRILELYVERRSVEPDVDIEAVSRRTAGFSGADLANLVNTAALLSVRTGGGVITMAHLEEALATVALGPARKSAGVAARDRTITAWHEAGHALVGLWLDDALDPISVSIVPRGQAGGVTWFPGHDDAFLTRRQAKAQLVVAMGGRVAEELLLGDDFTQGAAQDFRAATELARRMVAEYGMGSLGPSYVEPEATHIGVLADRVHGATDELLGEALATARAMLPAARSVVARVVTALLEDETLDAKTLLQLAGRHPPAPSCTPSLGTKSSSAFTRCGAKVAP